MGVPSTTSPFSLFLYRDVKKLLSGGQIKSEAWYYITGQFNVFFLQSMNEKKSGVLRWVTLFVLHLRAFRGNGGTQLLRHLVSSRLKWWFIPIKAEARKSK
ncbi:hypothetical protein CPAR01_02011 [Colletotrichum paranaense]|uniref:Uncharacterized protein n=1 Tax=Colletotrichum paranaense TaxID=1914294 RepID=A0ABQ9SZ27_9PEZI|nr:uncharacterized protein CPAR01_02011 [Colletotrichum paranaense]KAK1544509.1 hypothetical protein CPAR01_02011 [Colletotrichum paranaense]